MKMHCTLPILLAANQGCNKIIACDLAAIIHTLLNELLQLIQPPWISAQLGDNSFLIIYPFPDTYSLMPQQCIVNSHYKTQDTE